MKRTVALIALILLVTLPAYCGGLDSWTPTKGDVYGLVPAKDSIEYIMARVRCPYLTPVYHWEVVFDDEYSCTSAPPKGCGHCVSVWDRIDDGWSGIIVLRKKVLTDEDIAKMERLKDTSCSYDRIGLRLQWFDFLLSCSQTNFRALWQWPFYYHCLSYTALLMGLDNPDTVLPWDILGNENWEIILEEDL